MKTLSEPTGQRGELWLSFGVRGDRTALTGRYVSAPFGAVRANYTDGFGRPEVQITNPSGGILGGDHLELDVSLAPGASACVLTQAANKAYRGEESLQRARFRVGEGAVLEYLPHHLIPYPASNYRQQTTFDLAPGSTLITWDAYAAGRVARGERFAFGSLRSRTEIFHAGIPQAIDGLDLTGEGEPFGGYSYMAAAYVVAPDDLAPLAEELHEALYGVPGTLVSASVPYPHLCCVRLLTRAAPALYTLLTRSRTVARDFLGLPVAEREVV